MYGILYFPIYKGPTWYAALSMTAAGYMYTSIDFFLKLNSPQQPQQIHQNGFRK